jgi:Fe-S-cluster-containing dehydrogenase component
MSASAVATAIWPARTARRSTTRQRPYDQMRRLLRPRRRGQKPICVESCPLRALDFGPLKSCAKSTVSLPPSPRCRPRTSPGRVS